MTLGPSNSMVLFLEQSYLIISLGGCLGRKSTCMGAIIRKLWGLCAINISKSDGGEGASFIGELSSLHPIWGHSYIPSLSNLCICILLLISGRDRVPTKGEHNCYQVVAKELMVYGQLSKQKNKQTENPNSSGLRLDQRLAAS